MGWGCNKTYRQKKFRLIAFSLSARPDDVITDEIKNYFDEWIDAKLLRDEEIVSISRQRKVQIAVDLSGYTEGGRSQVFSQGLAPIQVTQYGYPGSLGSEAYDYLIADQYVISDELRKYYSEAICYLPGCYMPSNKDAIVYSGAINREMVGLPNNKFVYGCLNSQYKITPDHFDRFVSILNGSEDSVLWILVSGEHARSNLKQEFESRGIDSNRIVFANKETAPIHLRRFALMDVFIDTFPCGAHTTAAEALRMGVPLVTFIGRSFASRVAGSLLKNEGMHELIAHSDLEYVEICLRLYRDKKFYNECRHKSNLAMMHSPLFDSASYTKNLELGYLAMYENAIAGQSPKDIAIERL